MEKYLKRLCKAILSGKFNDEKYRQKKSWHGTDIMTEPLFCSYGLIGFEVLVFDGNNHSYTIKWDGDLHELTIDDEPWRTFINLNYLESNDIFKINESPIWPDYPQSVELETYTNGGEGILIDLEKVTKENLQSYINEFDINEKVMMWWRDGKETAKENGVPFDNILDHYKDYELFLKNLQEICNKMPF